MPMAKNGRDLDGEMIEGEREKKRKKRECDKSVGSAFNNNELRHMGTMSSKNWIDISLEYNPKTSCSSIIYIGWK